MSKASLWARFTGSNSFFHCKAGGKADDDTSDESAGGGYKSAPRLGRFFDTYQGVCKPHN